MGSVAYMFLDCGSSVSLVSPSFVNRVGMNSAVQKSSAVLKSFSNDAISVRGKVALDVIIGNLISARHEFIITDMLDVDFLIGLDFFETNSLSIDFGKSKLITRDGKYCDLFEKPRDIPHVMKVRCKETVTIAPHTVQFISGKIPRTNINHQGITEPYERTMLATGALMAPSIIYTDKRWVPIRCVNVSNDPITIYKGSMLGYLRPATENGCVKGVNRVEGSISDNDSYPSFDNGSHSVAGEEASRWTKSELYEALRLNEIQVQMSETEKQRLRDVLWQYRSCFAYDKDDFGCCNMFEAHIQLKRDYVPSWTPERKVPYNLEHHMDDLMENMLRTGVVEPLTTQSSWNSPLFLVAKSTPGTYRVVADLRGVNKQCLEDKYDLPNINHVLDRIGGDCIFSTFDMAASFHQVPYDNQSKPITAFSYKGRRYNFARMIMGHCSSSSIFTRMVYRLLEHSPSLEHLLYFLDDLLLGSRDVKTHIERLEMMLRQLMRANLKLTPAKTELMRSEVRYVGITLSSEGIRINDDRIEAIKRLEPPKTVKETQRVLGFFGYNRKFVRRYSELSKPLYALLQKGKKFQWTSQCQKSFEDLKVAISTAPTLCFPEVHDPHNSYQVTIDASKDGLAATLTQLINGQRRTVGFFSKAVPRHKREWGQTKLEFEALCASLKHWAVYLRGAKTFKVITDCKSLLHMDTIFRSNPTMIRRFHHLASYNFILEHIEGTRNVADFLSRYNMKSSQEEKSTQTDGSAEKSEMIKGITPHCDNTPIPETKRLEPSPHCEGSDKQVFGGQDQLPQICDKTCMIVDKAYEPSDLQLLFEGEYDSSVQFKVKRVEEIHCYCGIAEMPTGGDKVIDEEEEKVRIAAVKETPQVCPNRKRICNEQDKDQILKVVKEWVRKGEKPKLQSNRNPASLVSLWKQFNLLEIAEDGLLTRKWVNKKDPEQGRDLIVIPDNLVEKIMTLHHSNLGSCHPGVDLSVDLCRRKFYWPKMTEDFKEFIAACEKCNSIKQPQRYLRAPLQHMLFHNFGDCIVVDHIVPESQGRTPRGYRYILTITDAWSNYLVAIPVKTQTAKENIEQIVRRWTLIFGQPKEIIVDNHPGFSSDFFHAVWEYFDCKVTHGTSYSSKSSAKAERSNKRLNQALRAALPAGKERDWDIYLGYCVMALNSLRNRHTGYSSNRLVFGREANTPITLLVDNDIKTKIPSKGAEGAYELYKRMKTTLRKVRENADTDFLYSKNQHDRNVLGPYFKAGDLCYVLINCPQHKYSIRWRGPLLVKKVINDHLYVVQITPDMEKVINISKMKHFTRNRFNITKYPLSGTGTDSQASNSNTHTGVKDVPVKPTTDTKTSKSCLSKHVTFPQPLHTNIQDEDSDSSDEECELVMITPTSETKTRNPQVAKRSDLNEGDSNSTSLSTGGTCEEDSAMSIPESEHVCAEEPIVINTESEEPVEQRRYNMRDRRTLRRPNYYGTPVSPPRSRSNSSVIRRILNQLDGILHVEI